MRHSELSIEDRLKAEKAKDERQQSRKKGFLKMHERDASYATLRNYNGGTVAMQWHIPEDRREENIAYLNIPDGMFSLRVDGKLLVFDAEEFRRQLRWV